MAASAWTPVDETAAKWTPVDESAPKRSMLDRLANDPNDIPLDSYVHATESGLASIGKGGAQFIQGVGNLVRHPIDTISGMAKGATELPSQAAALAKDPPTLGQYGEVAGETAGQLIGGMGAGEVADFTHPAFQKALQVAKNIPAKAALRATGTAAQMVGDSLNPDLVGLVSPRAAHALRLANRVGKAASSLGAESTSEAPTLDNMADRLAQVIADQRAAAAPKLASIERDATRQNVPFAGEEIEEPPIEKTGQVKFSPEDRLKAKSLLEDSLKSSTDDVVDSAIKPGGENHGTNLQTKAQVDFHLQRGDIAGAEKALDSGIQEVNPAFNPAELFDARQGPVPSTMEIRQKLATAAGSPADIQETRGIQEQMRENLQRHQWSAESEARREFIARNTTGFTKTYGTQAQRDAAHADAMASDTGDMTDLLQKSLDQVNKRKAQQ